MSYNMIFCNMLTNLIFYKEIEITKFEIIPLEQTRIISAS